MPLGVDPDDVNQNGIWYNRDGGYAPGQVLEAYVGQGLTNTYQWER